MNDLKTWDAWKRLHQPFELQWWKDALATGHSSSPGFEAEWQRVKDWIKPTGRIIDIGCGPRPPFAPCVVIEPLADRYKEITPVKWWLDVIAYARPAERLIDSLIGQADTVICWNCIDHAIGWKIILDRMLQYGAPGARFAIATDFWPPFLGHPGCPKDEFLHEIEKRFVITDRREPFGRELALLMTSA